MVLRSILTVFWTSESVKLYAKHWTRDFCVLAVAGQEQNSSNCWMQDYLYQLQGEPGNTQVFMGEKHMLGDFVKFNNNGGSVNKAEHRHHCCLHGWTCNRLGWIKGKRAAANFPENIPHPCPMMCVYVSWGEIAQAFSHFTFDESHRELLVVDIQGVPSGEVDGSGIKLHLTDPQAGQMYGLIYIYIYISYIHNSGITYYILILIYLPIHSNIIHICYAGRSFDCISAHQFVELKFVIRHLNPLTSLACFYAFSIWTMDVRNSNHVFRIAQKLPKWQAYRPIIWLFL